MDTTGEFQTGDFALLALVAARPVTPRVTVQAASPTHISFKITVLTVLLIVTAVLTDRPAQPALLEY
jgi:hypothetical protein